MGGSPEWDNRMMDSLKNFDLNSPEVKEQFGNISQKTGYGFHFSSTLLQYQEHNQTKMTHIIVYKPWYIICGCGMVGRLGNKSKHTFFDI